MADAMGVSHLDQDRTTLVGMRRLTGWLSGNPGDEVTNLDLPEQLDVAARFFAADADVAVANHADVAQQPIVELGQRGALPAPREPPAQLPPRLPE
jgi:hypothetical protein